MTVIYGTADLVVEILAGEMVMWSLRDESNGDLECVAVPAADMDAAARAWLAHRGQTTVTAPAAGELGDQGPAHVVVMMLKPSVIAGVYPDPWAAFLAAGRHPAPGQLAFAELTIGADQFTSERGADE